ncbi:ABC transporter ATP-binding protein [Salininema proteolyticum]|uniref:ABC transporter ATP-binding protein n=1 Tax=Salininema proteolyticum TaxID=1607685 RepID=A0ABV8TWB9_9ACTN
MTEVPRERSSGPPQPPPPGPGDAATEILPAFSVEPRSTPEPEPDATVLLPAVVPALIELEDVAMTYPGPPPVEALKRASLRVGEGEYTAIVGPSGSGKSTLLNILGLLDRPTSGAYRLDGSDTSDLGERQVTRLRADRIGFVFQSFHLMPHRTAADNVAMSLVYRGIPRRRRREIAHGKLRQVGLSHRVDALPTTLSGGERQRVAIARALATEPSLLLCDEPTGSLDSETAAGVLDTIDRLHGEGLTVLMITHDPDVAARAGRTVTIRDGVLEEGSMAAR